MNIDQRINITLKSTKASLELIEIEKDNLEIVKDLSDVISHNSKVLLALYKVRRYIVTREKV